MTLSNVHQMFIKHIFKDKASETSQQIIFRSMALNSVRQKRSCPYCLSIGAQVYGTSLDRFELPTRANTDVPLDQIEQSV